MTGLTSRRPTRPIPVDEQAWHGLLDCGLRRGVARRRCGSWRRQGSVPRAGSAAPLRWSAPAPAPFPDGTRDAPTSRPNTRFPAWAPASTRTIAGAGLPDGIDRSTRRPVEDAHDPCCVAGPLSFLTSSHGSSSRRRRVCMGAAPGAERTSSSIVAGIVGGGRHGVPPGEQGSRDIVLLARPAEPRRVHTAMPRTHLPDGQLEGVDHVHRSRRSPVPRLGVYDATGGVEDRSDAGAVEGSSGGGGIDLVESRGAVTHPRRSRRRWSRSSRSR